MPEAGLQALWANSGTTLYGADGGWKIPFTKNKLFFFVAYEGYRQIQAAFLQAYVPTQAERNGDFSADLAGGAVSTQPPTVIFDPTSYATNCPAGGCSGANVLNQWAYNGHPNMINPAVISPLYTKFLNLAFPLPNGLNTNRGRQLRQQEQPDQIYARRLAGPRATTT